MQMQQIERQLQEGVPASEQLSHAQVEQITKEFEALHMEGYQQNIIDENGRPSENL